MSPTGNRVTVSLFSLCWHACEQQQPMLFQDVVYAWETGNFEWEALSQSQQTQLICFLFSQRNRDPVRATNMLKVILEISSRWRPKIPCFVIEFNAISLGIMLLLKKEKAKLKLKVEIFLMSFLIVLDFNSSKSRDPHVINDSKIQITLDLFCTNKTFYKLNLSPLIYSITKMFKFFKMHFIY